MTHRRAWDGRSAPTGRPGTPWLATPLVLLVSALILTVSLAAVGFRARQQLKLDEQSQRVSVWYTTQALVELHRLRSALLLRERGDGAADQIDVGERYDILLSRLPLLLQGEEATAEALTDRADMVHGIIDMLAAIEPDMLAWTPGAKATKARIEATLHEAEALLTQLNLALHVERQGAVVAARAHAADLNLAGLGGMGGLVLAGAMLLALLRRHARRALAAEAMLRALMDALPVAVSAYDRDGRVTLMNRASLSLLGHAEEAAVIGRTAAEVGAAREATAEIEQALRSGEVLPPSETVLDQPDGTQRHLLVTTAPVLGAGRLACLVRVGLDITEQRRADHRARHLEEHDPLTNLANRARFGALLGAALAELAEGEMLAVHCIDLDGFKQVNESLGHATGDRLLLAAGARIQGTLREGDLLARFGGDEFAVIQTRLSGRGEAEALANRLCRVLARAYRIEGQTLRSGASIGIVLAPEHGLASEALLSRADIALRAAKAAGRGRAKVFDPAQESGLKERLEIEECLRNALSERQLRLAYQPKFSAASGALHGCEALLRWYHPSRGPIPPSVFIPVAEAAGLMEELTRQVLDMACRQAAAWAETGLHLPIAVNLSGAQFGAGEGVAMLRAALDASGCRPDLIEVEVTEGVFLQDQAAAGESFAAMRALGVRIALDDFGTGFSSLGYLQHLRFDVIKIDRSFVGGIEHGGAGRRIVDAIVRLAHGLGAEVVAEGVETEAQLATLRALECDVVQGYLLARPMPPEQVAALRAPPPAAMPRVA